MRSRRPSFTVVATGQQWRIKDTADGQRLYYRACLVQYRDGSRAATYVRDDLVSVAA